MKLSLHAKLVLVVGIIVSVALVTIPNLLPLTGETGHDSIIAIGRFHIIALHFPICLLLVVPMMELLGCIRPMHYFKEAVQSVLWLAIFFAIGACALGFMLATGEGDVGKIVEDHMWGGIITTVLMFVALFVYELNPGQQRKGLYLTYLVFLFASVGSLTIGSHHGASLVHGEDYLYEKAPTFVKNMIGVKEEPIVQLTYDSPVYHTLIEPIFDQHCYSCHSELKQKGQFRIDDFALLLKGGKSEHAGVAPWDLAKSEVANRIVLPMTDKHVMPPKESAPMNREEIALIQWWIEGGAPETQSIDQLSFELYPEDVERIITTRIGASEGTVGPLDLATFKMVSKQVKAEFGVDVILYSQQLEDGVYVVTRNANLELPSDPLEDLESIAPHVHSINLWRRELAPDAFTALGQFSHLSELHLNESNVTTVDLASLPELRKLATLNLYGTAIGDDAIEPLAAIRSLRQLHLYNSQFTAEGVAQLQQALPRCKILYTFELPKSEKEASPAEDKTDKKTETETEEPKATVVVAAK
ncbi:MAG: hypothetical protein ACI8Z5_001661 [Lentimonas sp.]